MLNEVVPTLDGCGESLSPSRRALTRYLPTGKTSCALSNGALRSQPLPKTSCRMPAFGRSSRQARGESQSRPPPGFTASCATRLSIFYRQSHGGRASPAQCAAELDTTVPANDLTHDLVCPCIVRILPALTPGYAATLQAVDLNEQSFADLAQGHIITSGNATVRIHRASKAARDRMHRNLRCMRDTMAGSTAPASTAAASTGFWLDWLLPCIGLLRSTGLASLPDSPPRDRRLRQRRHPDQPGTRSVASASRRVARSPRSCGH